MRFWQLKKASGSSEYYILFFAEKLKKKNSIESLLIFSDGMSQFGFLKWCSFKNGIMIRPINIQQVGMILLHTYVLKRFCYVANEITTLQNLGYLLIIQSSYLEHALFINSNWMYIWSQVEWILHKLFDIAMCCYLHKNVVLKYRKAFIRRRASI